MNNNKEYYGNEILEKETSFNNKIKLEYYKTEDNKNYGLEIIKTEKNQEIETSEKIILKNITTNETIIDNLLNTIKKFKVTPISVSDIVEDYMYNIS